MLRPALVAILAVAVPSAAAAAPTAVPEPEEIVVQGERLTPAQARARAVAYIEHTGVTTSKESVARFVDPVCPRVYGVAPETANRVENRLRTIATDIGARTGKPGCTPNVTVNFVGDGAAFAQSIAKRERRQLSEVPANRRAALLEGQAPVRWWYLTQVRGGDGDGMNGMDPAFVAGDGSVGGGQILPSNGEASSLQNYNSSIISTQMARVLRSATVVVDTVRSEGATLDAVADYAAMVAFAEMQPRDTPLQGSILGLFGDPAAPRALSRLDETFLRELYSLPLDRKARQQRGRLVRALQAEQTKF